MKKFFINFTVLLVSLILSVALLEFGVRRTLPWYDPAKQVVFYQQPDGFPLGKPDSTIRQRTPKGDYDLFSRFNKYGFRDDKDLARSRSGDIFVVGDSFSFGWGLPDGERYSDILEKSLGRPVYNISIPSDIRGYQKLLQYAREKGAGVSSLVIGLCMENDLADYDVVDAVPVEGTPPKRGFDWRSFFKARSAVYLALSYELQKVPFLRKFLESRGLARDIEGRVHKNVLDENILASSFRALLKIVSSVDKAVILIIPSRMLWQTSNSANERVVHDRFLDLLRENGIPFVDMRPYFEAGGDPLQYYFKTDPHWNAAGHALAGEVLAEYFKRHGES